MTSIEKLILRGKTAEIYHMPTIKKVLNLDKIKQTTDRYAPYDYVGKKNNQLYHIEIKDRSIRHNQYPTVIINQC